MEEEQKNENEETEGSEDPQVSQGFLVDEAAKQAERLEKAIKSSEAVAARIEAVAARLMLSGKSEGGKIRKTPEQEREEELDRKVKDALKMYK